MATKRSNITAAAGWNVYLAVYRLSDGKIFDWSDNSWKLLSAPPVTPGLAMDSVVTLGPSLAEYAASVNLALINNTTTPVDVVIVAYHRLGGSMAPATDTPFGEGVDSFTIVSGDIAVPGKANGYRVHCVVYTNATMGNKAHCKVKLLDASGQAVIDGGATCALNVQRDGVHNQFTVSTGDFGAQNANGYWEFDYDNPNFTADVGYSGIATVVSGGVTYQTDEADFEIWA